MSTESLRVHDVLVVGGGIGGLAASIALGRRGVHTTVVESGTGAVGASIGIGERAVYALDELGILDQVVERGYAMSAEDEHIVRGVYEPSGRNLNFPLPVRGEDWTLPVGVRIYRPLLSEIMQAAAREHGAEVLFGHSYRSVEPLEDRVRVELTTGEQRDFDLLVAADGVHSALRSRFFPGAGEPGYCGSMSFRIMFHDIPDHWYSGRHVANGNTIQTLTLPDRLFYLALPNHMERRHIDQDEAREIVRTVLDNYRPSPMFDEICERLTDDVHVIVAPYEWIFVEPPWHRGRVVLAGDAVHATAPTMGAAGGMALEDAVVLAQELSKGDDVEQALTAYAERRKDRAKLVVETSARLMHTHQLHWAPEDEDEYRRRARQQLVAPY